MELFLSALWSLTANKLRSFLTMLGILIGVASIVSIIAVGSGGQSAIVSTIESARLQHTIQVVPSAIVTPGIAQPGQVLQFEPGDFDLVRQFTGVQSVYNTLYGQAIVSTVRKRANASVEAGPDFLDEIGHFTVVDGRMFTLTDVIAHRHVVLISGPLKQQLFPSMPAINQTVTIGGQPFIVIGVTASAEGNLLAGVLGSEYVYMPSTTCMDLFPWWTVSEMDVQAAAGVNKIDLSHRIVTALNIRAHNTHAFEDSSGLLLGLEKTVRTVTSILTLVIGSIAGIALMVGGVGVMNIMLVAVSERTQEIGIRMSLGATRRAILAQFLVESGTITLVGGLLGVVFGFAAILVLRMVTHFSITVPWWAVVGSVVFSVLIGVLCGLYPANKAARLDPIESLRHE